MESDENFETKENGKFYTPEELQLLIFQYINDEKTIDNLLQDIGDVGESLKIFIQKTFEDELLKYVKSNIKNKMTELVSEGKTAFIKEAQESLKLNTTHFMIWTWKLVSNNIPLKDPRVLDWIGELQKFYYFLESRFLPCEPEEAVKSLIIEWFETGEMSLEIWKQWNAWFIKGINLKTLKDIKWAQSSAQDAVKPRFIAALDKMPSDDFLGKPVLHKILNFYLEEPKMEMEIDEYTDENGRITVKETKTINIIGRTIFLSFIITKLEAMMKEKNAEQVDIVAKNTCHIDYNLVGEIWKGKNISIVADKINVWGKRLIDVSGKSRPKGNKRKAQNGIQSEEENENGAAKDGQDGKDGLAGETSGNITIITEEMTNPKQLTLNLNGGDGEDGEDGGDGSDGRHGKGITKKEFDDICIKYLSLYLEDWKKFKNYCPDGWTCWDEGESYFSTYIYKLFKDEFGREFYYTYGADKGFWYNWYELVVWIKGTDGTTGGIGGLNGKGGQGGNAGECIVKNPASDSDWPVKKNQENGKPGKEGKVGECGASGNNGNHIAMIDRSAKGKNKHYYGDDPKTPKRLIIKWNNKTNKMRRINRYRYIVENRPDYYGEFEYGELPKGGLKEQKQQPKKERSSEAETTMKQSIVLNKVMQKALEYCNKMDSAMNAATTSMSKIQHKITVNEEIEEEESAEQEQEVVIVKEVNEEQLDQKKHKAKKSKISPLEFLNNVKQKQCFTGSCPLTQELINYFLIEFDEILLKQMAKEMIYKGSMLREILQNPLQKTIVAAVQSKKRNGLSYYELEKLPMEYTQKRLLKRKIASIRDSVSKFARHCQTAKLDIDPAVTKNGEILEKVKFKIPEIDDFWSSDVATAKVEEIVNSFFMDYRFNEIDGKSLSVICTTFQILDEKYSELFKTFENDTVTWADEESWGGFKQTLAEANPILKTIMVVVAENKEWFTTTFKKWSEVVNNASLMDKVKNQYHGEGKSLKEEAQNMLLGSEMEFRFGKIPNHHNKHENNLEFAQFLIRYYWQMKKLIKFNKTLMILNLLNQGESDKKGWKILKSYQNLDINALIKRINQNKVEMESNACQEEMILKKFQSIAFRFLISTLFNRKIEIYGNENYGTVELVESWEGEDILQLYFDGKNYYDIESDNDLKHLVAARDSQNLRHFFHENLERLNKLTWNYRNNGDKALFVNYFSSAFKNTIDEWIDCYLTSTKNDSTFLKMLHERFEVDGNHLSVTDFQFLISTAITLQNKYCVSPEFILNFAVSLPQKELIDNFIILRLESQWRKQLSQTPAYLITMNKIQNNRLKILLATKLENAQVDENNLKQLFFMLQHTSANNSELEKMSLDEWIIAAKKQKYYEINNSIKDCGNIGYYIIYLKQASKIMEAEALEKLLLNRNITYHIPEKLIAQVCSLICYNEVIVDSEYIQALDEVLKEITKLSKRIKTRHHFFISDEAEQSSLLEKVKNMPAFVNLLSEKERTEDVIADLIKGVHDEGDAIYRRKTCTNHIVTFLQDPINENTIILEKVNQCIQKIKGISLRNTQKMAIMYAVESDQHLLSQVNTGEGKSYIVAAIAIIRASQFKYVDIITSSPVLAQRDAAEMQSIYEAMGINVDHNCHDDLEKRKQAYKANVVYGEISRFQRDYLLHTFYRKNILGSRDRQTSCVIVDEVDNMLLDNGNNMLYLSHSVPGMDLLEPLFVHIEKLIISPTIKGNREKAFETETIRAAVLSDLIGRISKENLELMANTKEAKKCGFDTWTFLIEFGILDSEGYFVIETITDFNEKEAKLKEELEKRTTELQTLKILTCIRIVLNRSREISIPRYLIPFVRQHLTEYIENAKRALFMKSNEAYVVDVDHTQQDCDITPKITIIDQNTGVDLATSQWSEALHQFIQIKHGCRLNSISMKAVFISNVNYLKAYKRINGLTGTLGSIEESKTLVDLYGADLIKIPTFKAKRLYEHVPVIAKTEEAWLDNIFEEIADQVKARRSVLLICRTIAEVLNIEKGLLDRYAIVDSPDKTLSECYEKENLTVYQREFDEFDFGDTKKLLPGRLIIATNLAGRGTDIKLSDELKKTGGLHVIVSFLPENSRIEDQAYGRAARCGDPGSGQIIAITDQIDVSGKSPSVFELKTFRDHAEVQRLQSMSNYYNFHTKIEEECLMAFKEHCLEALGKMNNSGKQDNGVPTESEIIYFALLDKWALWLDSKASEIKQCAQDRDYKQKAEIIASVKEFLVVHSINTMEEALAWINCPQPLLALGLAKLDAKNYDEAKIIFDKIISNFPEFSGEACYYKGLMRQWDVRIVKNIPEIGDENRGFFKKIANSVGQTVDSISQISLSRAKDILPDSLCELDETARIETEDLFLHSIRTFNQRTENRQNLQVLVSRMQHLAGPKNIKSSGFKNQGDDIEAVNDCLITSACNLIGHPINFTTFVPDAQTIEEKFKGQKIFLRFEREGYVSPKMLIHQILDEQCEVLKSKYMISKTKIKRIFEEFLTDSNKMEFYDRTVLPEMEFIQKCKLLKREEFWGFLDCFGCLNEKQDFYVLQTMSTEGKIEELEQLQPMDPIEPEALRIQLSDYDLTSKIIYKAEDVEKVFKNNKAKLKWLDSMEYLVKDSTALINMEEYVNTVFMPNYDYFTEEELAEWLEIPVNQTSWIISRLLNNSTIREESQILTKANNCESLTLTPEQEEKYKSFLSSKELQKIDDINIDVVKVLFQQNDDDEALKIFEELENLNIIIHYDKIFYFQNIDDLECPYLPECIRNMVESFLYHKFAYTFAYDALLKNLQLALDNPTIKKSIMLPWKPDQMLLKDLIKYGFVHDHKLEVRDKDYLEKAEQAAMEEIEKKMKSRLFIKSGTLKSTKKYFKDEKVVAGVDVQTHAINSMKQVGKIGENNWWLLWLVFKIAFAIFMAWSFVGIALAGLDLILNFNAFYTTTLTVLAAIGTMLYFKQIMRAKYKSQTGNESSTERYSQLLDFHSYNIKLHDKHKNEAKLTKIIASAITTKVTDAISMPNIEFQEKFYETAKQQKLGQRKFIRLAIQFSNSQTHNWRKFDEATRNFLIRIKPQIAVKYFDILCKNKSANNCINVENAAEDCKKLDDSLKIAMKAADLQLIKTIFDKIIEDVVVAIQESGETGDDEKEIETPKELLNDENFELDFGFDEKPVSQKQTKIGGYSYGIQEMNSLYKNFIDSCIERTRNALTFEISNEITKPLLRAFKRFIESRSTENEESVSFAKFLEEDKEQKLTYEEHKKQDIAFQSMPFIIRDLQKVVRQQYEDKKWDNLFSMMILYGHALSKATLPKLADILYLIVKEIKPEIDQLNIVVDDNSQIIEFASPARTEKATSTCSIMLTLTHGYYYICQADSKKIYKNKKNNDYIGACLFEAIVNKNPELKEISKQGSDIFRQMLLDKLIMSAAACDEKKVEENVIEEGFEAVEKNEDDEDDEMPSFSTANVFGNSTKGLTSLFS